MNAIQVGLTRELRSREQRRRRKTSNFAYHGIYQDFLQAASAYHTRTLTNHRLVVFRLDFRRSLVSGLLATLPAFGGGERLLSRTAAGDRALVCVLPHGFSSEWETGICPVVETLPVSISHPEVPAFNLMWQFYWERYDKKKRNLHSWPKETQQKKGICTLDYLIRVMNNHAGSTLTLPVGKPFSHVNAR